MPPNMSSSAYSEPIPLLSDTMTTPDEKLPSDLPSTAQQFSPSETEPEKNKTDWRSIYVASFLALSAGVQCSLYYSSLWPYLQVIDKTATEKFYGTVIAFYSVGQIIGSPLVGYWSNRCKNISTPAIYGLCLAFAGNLVYLLVELVPTNRKYCILFARFIIGLGSSNITLLRVYASTASVPKDRSRAIAMTVGGSALGMTVGPLFQLIASPMSYPGWRLFGGLSLNIYSTPALMACGMDIVAMLAVKFLFKEHYAGIVKNPKNTSGESVSSLPKCDYVAVALVHIARFAQVSVATTLELLNTPIGMTMFAFSKAEVVRYVSLSHSLRSLLAFSIFVFYAVVKVEERFKRLDFRINCLASLTGLIGFFLLTFSWPFIPGHVQTFSSNSTSFNATSAGCDTSKFSWCDGLSPVSPFMYYACYILVIGFFFPNLNIALTTLFSRILGPRRQGTQQGLMQMSSSSARLIGPLLVSTVYTEFGPRAAWMLPIAVTSLSIALWITCYQRLAPCESRTSKYRQGIPPNGAIHSQDSK